MTATTPILAAPAPANAPGLPAYELVAALAASDHATSHYDRTQIRLVRPGDAIAVVRTGDPRLLLGANTALDPDGATIRATCAGRAATGIDDGRLCVETALEIPGDLDFAVGNVDFPGDVAVAGNVLDLFKLRGAGSIHVGGDVEGADVRAMGDVRVAGGIVAKDRGSIRAGGAVRARYATNADVDAAGDVECESGIANSTIVSGGRVAVARGAIVAGRVTATGGVSCLTLGSAAGVLTVIEAGVDEAFRRQLPGAIDLIEALRAKAKKIEQTVQPLLQHQKTLTAAQREKATELLFEAGEMNQTAAAKAAQLKARYAAIMAVAKPEVHVGEMLHQGVVLRFPGVQTRIMNPFAGPLQIVLKVVRNEREIRLIDPASGALQQLGAESVPDPVAAALAKL